MREVRMTFGEHLEELRKRIFFSLLWLGLAVALSLVYGKSLLKWTMGPHEIAIRGAMRDHSISVLEAKGLELNVLAEDPSAASDASTRAEPAPAAAAVWDRLFIADIGTTRLRTGLKDLEKLSGELAGRPELEHWAQSTLGVITALARIVDPESLTVGARSLPERFRLLEEDLRRSAQHVRATPVKRLL